jgi:hypothetical protein
LSQNQAKDDEIDLIKVERKKCCQKLDLKLYWPKKQKEIF